MAMMLAHDLRQQLRDLGRTRAPARPRPAPAFHLSRSLSETLDGAVLSTPHGELFVWEKSLRDAYSDGSALADRLLACLAKAAQRRDEHPAYAPLAEVPLERVAVIDLETAGLHGRPLFMIGTLRWDGCDLLLRQTFARDYSEERAVLADFHEQARGIEALVSFNGKCFDWPFLRDRTVYHRLRAQEPGRHLDLLHPSRRRWRGELPDCRLQTLERHLCRRVRHGDIPGHLIPQRYHEFVHCQDPRLIAPVFHHNRLDLITMVELLIALLPE
jgi:uncharacterized protein YprB with RNaseH-like and TPR domain